MHPWAYFSRPSNMAFHDLSAVLKPPKNLRSLLGLSLKFIPSPRTNVPWTAYEDHNFSRFDRELKIKVFMADHKDDGTYNPDLYVKSRWTPPPWKIPLEITRRLHHFKDAVKKIVKTKQSPSNLLLHQKKALNYLRHQQDFLVVQCDKNLGPAIIERDKYIKLAFRDHLNNTLTYRRLSPIDAAIYARYIRTTFKAWIEKYKRVLTKNEAKFLRRHLRENTDPFGCLYLLVKIHQSPMKTRPIISLKGSLLHGLGLWANDKLQQYATRQKSYFKSSFDLKIELVTMDIPPGARLFIADAVSMYTNINTDSALQFVSQHIREHVSEFTNVPAEALIEALEIIITLNVFTFGDTTWIQDRGTAMGSPPFPLPGRTCTTHSRNWTSFPSLKTTWSFTNGLLMTSWAYGSQQTRLPTPSVGKSSLSK
jgi:hypothetical protein